jgi:hypothetical protein
VIVRVVWCGVVCGVVSYVFLCSSGTGRLCVHPPHPLRRSLKGVGGVGGWVGGAAVLAGRVWFVGGRSRKGPRWVFVGGLPVHTHTHTHPAATHSGIRFRAAAQVLGPVFPCTLHRLPPVSASVSDDKEMMEYYHKFQAYIQVCPRPHPRAPDALATPRTCMARHLCPSSRSVLSGVLWPFIVAWAQALSLLRSLKVRLHDELEKTMVDREEQLLRASALDVSHSSCRGANG